MERYNFTETKDNIFWDEFILQSENKNIFTLSDYLSLEDNIKFFIIKKTEEIKGAIALKIVNKEIVPCKYLPQTPLIYRINNELNDYKKNKKYFMNEMNIASGVEASFFSEKQNKKFIFSISNYVFSRRNFR